MAVVAPVAVTAHTLPTPSNAACKNTSCMSYCWSCAPRTFERKIRTACEWVRKALRSRDATIAPLSSSPSSAGSSSPSLHSSNNLCSMWCTRDHQIDQQAADTHAASSITECCYTFNFPLMGLYAQPLSKRATAEQHRCALKTEVHISREHMRTSAGSPAHVPEQAVQQGCCQVSAHCLLHLQAQQR